MQFITNNAIAWAAFQLQGGWKNILLTAGGYGALIAVGVMTAAQFATVPLAALMFNLLVALLVIQGALLLLFAPTRVQNAVRRDVNDGMIESHRLMPLAPTRAVLGYVLGPVAQPMALVVATFLVGAIVAHAAAVPFERWLVSNFLLAELAVVVWVVMGTAALHNAQAAFLSLFFILPSAFNASVANAVPGAVLLLPPLIGKTVFDMPGQIEQSHLLAFLLHAVIVAVFVRAAARKYVRGDATALTPAMGLLLLACWSMASIVAMYDWDQVRPRMFRLRARPLEGVSVLCTLVAGALLAMSPVTLVARSGNSFAPRSQSRLTSILVPLAVFLLAVLLAVLPAVLAPASLERVARGRAVAFSVVAVAGACGCVFLLAKAFYLHGIRAWLPIVAWLLVTSLAPIAYDAAQHALLGDGSEFRFGAISDVSPLGTLRAVWIDGRAPEMAGIAAQGGLIGISAALLMASYAILRWRHSRFAATPETSPVVSG